MPAVANLNPPASPSLVIIGCGNLNRSDDGAGVRVIQQLRLSFADTLPEGVTLFDAGTGGIEVMFKARGATALIVIDACRSGSDAGAVFRLPGSEIDTAHQPAYSLHDFRWDHAVHAGRRIFGADFPTDLTVYLIEAGSLELGTELTLPVSRAVGTVCDHVATRIRAFQAARCA
ncbi:MAG: hydrogenase maturation protease [Burkholderiaceae bacterium]|nr:hydrogenase maturation protease [Burkholderiaceae bacterium]